MTARAQLAAIYIVALTPFCPSRIHNTVPAVCLLPVLKSFMDGPVQFLNTAFIPSSSLLQRTGSSHFHPSRLSLSVFLHVPRPVLLVFIPLPINCRDVLKVIHRSPILPCINVLRQCSCRRYPCPWRQRYHETQRRSAALQRQSLWQDRHRPNSRFFHCHSCKREWKLLGHRHQLQWVSIVQLLPVTGQLIWCDISGADGSRSIKTVQVDASGDGKNFVPATMTVDGDPVCN